MNLHCTFAHMHACVWFISRLLYYGLGIGLGLGLVYTVLKKYILYELTFIVIFNGNRGISGSYIHKVLCGDQVDCEFLWVFRHIVIKDLNCDVLYAALIEC